MDDVAAVKDVGGALMPFNRESDWRDRFEL